MENGNSVGELNSQWKGDGVYFKACGETDDVYCTVCGALCNVNPKQYGPAGYIAAMGGHKSMHDVFTCPHGNSTWHTQAVSLKRSIDKLPDSSVADLLRREIQILVNSHLHKD